MLRRNWKSRPILEVTSRSDDAQGLLYPPRIRKTMSTLSATTSAGRRTWSAHSRRWQTARVLGPGHRIYHAGRPLRPRVQEGAVCSVHIDPAGSCSLVFRFAGEGTAAWWPSHAMAPPSCRPSPSPRPSPRLIVKWPTFSPSASGKTGTRHSITGHGRGPRIGSRQLRILPAAG